MSKTTEVEIYLGEGVYVYEEIETIDDEKEMENMKQFIVCREQVKSMMSNKNSLDYFKQKNEHDHYRDDLGSIVGYILPSVYDRDYKNTHNRPVFSDDLRHINTIRNIVGGNYDKMDEAFKLFLKNQRGNLRGRERFKKKFSVELMYNLLKDAIEYNKDEVWTTNSFVKRGAGCCRKYHPPLYAPRVDDRVMNVMKRYKDANY